MPVRSLARREPYAPDVYDIRRGFDELFSRLSAFPLDLWNNAGANIAWIPPVESFIDQNRYCVRLSVPGVKPNEVNVQVHGNELSISGERRQEISPAEDRSFQREITYGAFERILPLPEGVQADKIEANFNNGVLEITAPLSEAAMPRKIEVKSQPLEKQGEKKLAA